MDSWSHRIVKLNLKRLNPPLFRILGLILSCAAAWPAFAAEHGQMEASEALFTVLAAANVAGYNAGLAASPPLREQARERLAATKAPIITQLKEWYLEHPQRDKTLDLIRFISLGLSVKDPPKFEWNTRDLDVPPDAMALSSFRELLPAFYEQAKIEELWQASQSAIDQTLELYQEPVAKTVLEANAYLRNSTSGYLGRRFQIFLDVMGAPNQVQTRSYGDNYFVVLTPSMELKVDTWKPAEPRLFEIRHAYLRYLIDPLAIKYGMELNEKQSLLEIAESAPLLKDPYRSSFDLMATECLIKAIESRMLSNSSLITDALRAGYVLTPYFAEQLMTYENQPDSMRLFFPKMVHGIDVKRETKRLQGVQFAKEAPDRSPIEAAAAAPKSLAAQSVAQADTFYDKRDLENARRLYERALELDGSPTDHSGAYYGLAHIALMQNDAEKADQLFRKTLNSSPEQEIRSWSCYYLGKLSAVANDREEATKWFQQAVAVPGANQKAVDSSRRELRKMAETPEK